MKGSDACKKGYAEVVGIEIEMHGGISISRASSDAATRYTCHNTGVYSLSRKNGQIW